MPGLQRCLKNVQETHSTNLYKINETPVTQDSTTNADTNFSHNIFKLWRTLFVQDPIVDIILQSPHQTESRTQEHQ